MVQFEHMIAEQDRTEATRVNELFDEAKGAFRAGGALAYALEVAETEFTDKFAETMPGAKEYGYGLAKNAFRWLSYSTAYLDDLKEAGDTTPGAQAHIPAYEQEKNRIDEVLADPEQLITPVSFQLFDMLARERIQDILDGRAGGDPFLRGREHAALLLTQGLEVIFQDPDARSPLPAEEGMFKFVGAAKAKYIVHRPVPRGSGKKPVYVIDKYVERDKSATYLVDGTQDPQDRASVINSFRGSEPGVDICAILDIIEATLWNNPPSQDEALERTEAILGQRRAAGL